MRTSTSLFVRAMAVALTILVSKSSLQAQVKYQPLRGTTPSGGVVQVSSLPQSSGPLSHPTAVPILGRSYSPTVQKYMEEQKASSNVTPSQEQDNPEVKLNYQQMKQGTHGAVLSPTSVSDVLSANFQGIPWTGYYPPDPVIAVGPNYVVVAVNLSFAIYNKSGSKISQTDFSSFFGSSLNLTDPKVIYDQYSQRFVMLVLAYGSSQSQYLIAASASSDPTGSWYKYASDATLDGTTPTTNGADFPGLGFDSQAIYVTSNQYADYLTGSFQYAKIRIFNKSQLYNNQTLSYTDFVGMSDNYGTVFTIKPAHHFGTTSSAYLINTENGGGSSVTLWRIDNPITSPTLTEQATVSVASYSVPVGAVQEGNTATIDAGDCRTQDCIWRDGNLYSAFTTSYNWGSGNVDAIQYLEINTNSNTATIDAVYGDASSYYIYPNIYVDNYGDLAMVFSRSSSNEYASVRWTYRTPSDASMRASQTLQEGAGTYVNYGQDGRNRWGDYSGICLDPSSDNQVTHISYHSSVIANWNGSTWREYPVSGGALVWIAGLAPNDIWASGDDVVFHYNGSIWQKSPIPMPPQGMIFATIAEVAPNDVYTVGSINDVTPPADTGSYFLYHFDGSSWSIIDSVIVTSTYVSPITFGEKLFAVGGHLYTSWGEGIQELTGTGWATISNDTRILFLGGNNPDNLFGVGSYGAVDWYNGSTWQEINVGARSSIAMYSVWTDGSQTFISGYDGYKTYIYHGH